MKIGIIGDTHFGAAFNLGKTDPDTQLNTRLLDYSNTLNKIVDEFIKNGVSTLVFTGDIYETRQPTSAQLNAFSKCLSRAIKKGLSIIIVVGNHDQQRTISATTLDIFDSLDLNNISVFSNMGVHSIIDKNGKCINLFLMPYRDRRMINASTNSLAIKEISDELTELYNGAKDGDCNIVIGHYMLANPDKMIDPELFSINELALPLDIFNNFDATVMGHIHKHDIISTDPVIIYSGSMEKVSMGEREHKKVSIILNTDDISNFKIINNNVRPLYEMSFDYSDDKPHKNKINDAIKKDIDIFNKNNNLKDSIVKFNAKVKDIDLYYVDQSLIKNYINNKDIQYLSSMSIASVASRQLRNKSITEDLVSHKAIKSFIENLVEPDSLKKKLFKYATEIMEEVDGK